MLALGEAPDGQRRRLALHYGDGGHRLLRQLLRFLRLSPLPLPLLGVASLAAVAMAEPLGLLPLPRDPGRAVRETRRLLRRLALRPAAVATLGRVSLLLFRRQTEFVQAQLPHQRVRLLLLLLQGRGRSALAILILLLGPLAARFCDREDLPSNDIHFFCDSLCHFSELGSSKLDVHLELG